MNINIDIVNRALEAAGQERLNDDDIIKNSTRWRLIKDNYLAVILTTLNNTAWASQIRRKRLEEAEIENLSDYAVVYYLPHDCAKPEALNDNGEYIVEGRYLYTNSPCNILQYVSNGRRTEEEITEEMQEEDYPEYNDLDFDPSLSEYIELLLAAKIALKITGDPNTYGLLYNNAMLIENNARKANLEHAHSKEQGEPWWGDQIGLSVEGK